ncbi:MAG: alpha/beta fold hydrolase [Gammaproteobacteria bacterium]|nr:alpha/beta fold hydrolase [Gammaproteobacteria bacterium]
MKAFEIGAKDTVVFFVHGLRGHGLAQKAALQHLVKNVGVRLISLELPGHGADSVVRHCLVPPYQFIVDDIRQEVQRRASEADQVILMGYSFGAALVMLAAQALHEDTSFKPLVAGVVGVSTAFDVGHNVPRWQLALSKAVAPISRFLFEKAWRLSNSLTIHEMKVELISPDKTVQRSIARDPLVYKGRIPLATSAQVYRAGVAARTALENSTLPTLLLHSKDDSIAIAPSADDFGQHVELRLFSRLRHNCIDGISREVAVARRAITKFIAAKL